VSIIDDLLATLGKDAPVREVRIGAFWTVVVLEDGEERRMENVER